ncbi:MAG: shikimate dehydrogenase [Planctomycetaceae bacterium]|nr:shikimate dehydrogenase [Planctomycetaceae bacterium]
MICVSIGRNRHSHLIQGHRPLAERGAELAELRVDWIQRKPDIGRLLRERPTPVVITCRRLQDQGKWFGTEEQRQSVLREAILAEADYVDIEEDIAGSLPRYGKTKRIVSYHNFETTPEDLADIHRRMTDCDPDIIKIVTTAVTPQDNVTMLNLVKSAAIPTVGFCMGDLGTVSRILCGRMGAPWTYAGADRAGQIAPGQLTFDDMLDLYRYDSISPQTRLFGVIGDPIGHSLSPLLHNTAFRRIDFDGCYVPFRIPPDHVAEALRGYQSLGFEGFSVTIPHKQAALQFADIPDETCRSVGAANTLYLRDDRWHAANTDAGAIADTILAALRTSEDDAVTLAGKRVLILGAGGVARAAVCAMKQQGAEVCLSNRTADRAEQLAAEFSCAVIDWEQRGTAECDVLINGTSVGMHPNVDASPFDADWLQPSTLVFDTVYTPENTKLLRSAADRGCRTAGGLEMFVRQAARQFEMFTGQPAPFDNLTETLRTAVTK